MPRPLTLACAAGLLTLQVVLAGWAIVHTSPTCDEVNHLPAGVSYVEQLSFGVYHHNPPLLKTLAAIPVLLMGAQTNYGPGSAWDFAERQEVPIHYGAFGRDFQRANFDPAHYQRLFIAGRAVVLCFSFLGAVVAFVWARELANLPLAAPLSNTSSARGDAAGLTAMALWVLSPNFLAHSGVVTTDVPAATAALASTWLFWRWLRTQTPTAALGVGVALGLAQLIKFSLLILFGIWPVLALVATLAQARAAREIWPAALRRLGHTFGCGLVMLAGALLTINLGYLFEGTGQPLGKFEFLSTSLTQPRTFGPAPYPNSALADVYRMRMNRFRDTWLEGLPVPLPEHYVLGFDEQLFEAKPGMGSGGYPMYLRGELRRSGWSYYYTYALAIKEPLGTWLLVGAALAAACIGVRWSWPDEMPVWFTPLAMLAAMSLLTDINIGVRYVLAVLPFLYVGASRVAAALWATSRRWLWGGILGVGLTTNLAAVLTTAPDWIAYFNVLAGGPAHGHEHLIDSNIDWGQDLYELRRVLDARGHRGPLPAALFGNMDPLLAGLDVTLIPRDPRTLADLPRHPLEPAALTPGLYAVSVNYVLGYPYRWLAGVQIFQCPEQTYSYFRDLTPVAQAGRSIWIYDLTPADCARLNSNLGLGQDVQPVVPEATPPPLQSGKFCLPSSSPRVG